MNRINIVSIIISLGFLLFVIQQVRKKRLSEAYSLLWVGTGIVFITVSAWPQLLGHISNFIGIQYPPATLFLLLIVCMLLLCFQFSILLTVRSKQTKRLTQEIALLKNKLENLQSTNLTNEKSKTKT